MKIAATIDALEIGIEESRGQLAQLESQLQMAQAATVVATKVIYPNVLISINGKSHKVTAEGNACEFGLVEGHVRKLKT